ncbi:ThuA domain-containing protein [bacterium]|nr:ThuA domain-containing protein [bacterium]
MMKIRMTLACSVLVIGIQTICPAQEIFDSKQMSRRLKAGLSKEDIRRIEEALPAKAQAKPGCKRSLLVFNLHIRDGRVEKGHASIPYANYAILRMGEKTGAYRAFFSSDTSVFTAGILGRFDALCFNNTAGVLFEAAEKRQALLDYIRGGRGFAGIHAAGATFVQWPVYDQWPAFGEMLGGYENGGHPWKPDEWITLKVDDPSSPVNAMFEGGAFRVSDEVFQFQDPWSRRNLHVLLSIDTCKTDMSESRRILPERRKDGDLAISWIRRYGGGRVFYSSLGHNPHINWDPNILAHYLAGFQFVMGDLKADTEPDLRSEMSK